MWSPAGWITAPGDPEVPLRRPLAGPYPRPCSYLRAGVSLLEEGSRSSPGADGAPHQGGPALFWLRWICQRLCGCPDPPFAAFASIELKYVKELLD